MKKMRRFLDKYDSTPRFRFFQSVPFLASAKNRKIRKRIIECALLRQKSRGMDLRAARFCTINTSLWTAIPLFL